MRFICYDLESTSWEDDVNPRHLIMVRQTPPAADPKPALQSLVSISNVRTHTHTHLHFHHIVMLFHKTAHQIAIVFLSSVLFDRLKLYVSHSKKHRVTCISVWGRTGAQKKVPYDFFLTSHNNNLTVKAIVTQMRRKSKKKKKRSKLRQGKKQS